MYRDRHPVAFTNGSAASEEGDNEDDTANDNQSPC